MLLVTACVSPADTADTAGREDSDAETQDTGATPWDPDLPDKEAPPLDLATLQAALEAVPGQILAIEPHAPLDTYRRGLDQLTATCPARSDHNGQELATGDCTVGATTFYGFQVSVEVAGMTLNWKDLTAYHRMFRWMTGAARIVGEDTLWYQGFGDALYRDYDAADGTRVHDVYLWGEFASDVATGWLAERLGVELHLRATAWPDGRRAMTVDGGLSRLGGAVSALDLTDFAIDSSCPDEPTGGLRLWDEGGTWYTFDWGACDGCAEVSVLSTGEVLGEVCADFSALVDWRESPWG